MGIAAKPTRENRTITVDLREEATYVQLLGNGKAFLECVLAFVMSLGFQLAHKATCGGGGCLTRHSHYVRVRLSGVTIWRLQCTTCRAVFTVLPHFVLRYRPMRPEVAHDALLATHGGLSLERCAMLYRHCQVNRKHGTTGWVSGALRSFRGHLISPSGTSEPQNRTKYPPNGRDFFAHRLT